MFPDREGLLNDRLELIRLGADELATAVSTGMAVIASVQGGVACAATGGRSWEGETV